MGKIPEDSKKARITLVFKRHRGRIWGIKNCSATPLFLGEVVGQISLQTISKCVSDKQMVGRGQYGFMIRETSVHKVQQINFCTWAGIPSGIMTGWAPAGWRLACQKKMWCLGGHQACLGPARCPCGKGSKWPPGLCEGKCCQQIEGGDPFLLLSPGNT